MNVAKLTIRNPQYYRKFDNTDNPCCWHVDVVGKDVEAILRRSAVTYSPMYEDWGASFSWTNDGGIEHSLTVACIDVDQAAYEFEYFAFERRWLLFTGPVPENRSDFARIVPLLRQLGGPS